MSKPIAITMGDPCGIGSEICAKVFAEGLPAPALVVGDASLLRRTAKALGLDIAVREIADVAEAAGAPGELAVLGVSALPADLPIGKVDARAGRASYEYVVTAIELAMAGAVGGIADVDVQGAPQDAAAVRAERKRTSRSSTRPLSRLGTTGNSARGVPVGVRSSSPIRRNDTRACCHWSNTCESYCTGWNTCVR